MASLRALVLASLLAVASCVETATPATSVLAPSSRSSTPQGDDAPTFLQTGQQAQKKKGFFGKMASAVGSGLKAVGGAVLAVGGALLGGTSGSGKKAPGCQDWTCTFREMMALQNRHEMEATKINRAYYMKYSKLQEQLTSHQDTNMMPGMLAQSVSQYSHAPAGSMFGGVSPLPPAPPSGPI